MRSTPRSPSCLPTTTTHWWSAATPCAACPGGSSGPTRHSCRCPDYLGSSYFSETSPSPAILPVAVLPGGTNWQATMLPLETIMPFFNVLPCSPSLLASQARALWGWPSTSPEWPVRTTVPSNQIDPSSLSISSLRQSLLVLAASAPASQPACMISGLTASRL